MNHEISIQARIIFPRLDTGFLNQAARQEVALIGGQYLGGELDWLREIELGGLDALDCLVLCALSLGLRLGLRLGLMLLLGLMMIGCCCGGLSLLIGCCVGNVSGMRCRGLLHGCC